MNREVCWQCRKAQVMCYCKDLETFTSDPQFIILIHPKEARKAINTGRIAHRFINNSRLLVGIDFSQHTALNRLLADDSKRHYLLFPGAKALDLSSLPQQQPMDKRPMVFIILDATWPMAKQMYKLSANLQLLPQVAFHPAHPSKFLIRQQPHIDCYSTIETIHHIIEVMGTHPQCEHHGLMRAFHEMVRRQINYKQQRIAMAAKV